MNEQLKRQTRDQDHTIAIDRPIEAVWKALTNPRELTGWLGVQARVEPADGGRIWLSWGGSRQQEWLIEGWDPPNRLQLRLLQFSGSFGLYDTQQPIVEEFFLAASGSSTTLRMVHSKIPAAAQWESYYGVTNSCWKIYFCSLRHYLEHHSGKQRKLTETVRMLPGSLDQAWSSLIRPMGIGSEPRAGEGFSVRNERGTEFSGRVLLAIPLKAIVLTVRELDHALVAQSMAYCGPYGYLQNTLSVYGEECTRVKVLGEEWSRWFIDALQYGDTP